MIFFILFIFPMSNGQKLLIDSRENEQNQAPIELFENKFSIWFTTQRESDDISEIFQIRQNRKVIVKVTYQKEELQIYESKTLKQKINYNQLDQQNQWYHVIIRQYDIKQNVSFDLSLYQNSTIYSFVKFNSSLAIKNETNIMSRMNKNYFCLIYDSLTKDQQPIINKITFYTFVMPQIIEYLFYYNNSSAILILRKFQQQYQSSKILGLYNDQQELFALLEDKSNLYLLLDENEDKDVKNLGYVNEKQFIFSIDISMEYITINIQLLDKDYTFKIINIQDKIFFTLKLFSTVTNFDHLQIIKTYRLKLEEVDKQLYDLQCDKYQFYDRDDQKCLDAFSIYNTNVIQDNYTQVQLSILLRDQNEYIRNLIYTKILMSLDIDDIQSTLLIIGYIMTNEQEQQSREIYILWEGNLQIICQKFYFGSNCRKFEKQCLQMGQNSCIVCTYGYVNIKFKCKKCPKYCLICNYINHTIICLISMKGYYINNKGLSKICNCEYCSYQDVCLDIGHVRELIDICEQSTSCLLKKCLPSEYLSIRSQKCIRFPKDIELYLLLYVADNRPAEQVIIGLQNKIIQGNQLFKIPLSQNQMLMKLYFEVQMFNKYNRLLEADLSHSQYHTMNRYNLNCQEKMINYFGDIVCKKYSQQDNIQYNIQYLFTIELYNVSYSKEIIYQQQQFTSLTHLIQQIKDVGVKYTNITIELFIKEEYADNLNKIFIDKSQLPDHVRFANIILFLQFPQKYDIFSRSILQVEIDYLYIIDYYAQYNIELIIKNVQMVTFQNFSSANQFQLQGQSIKNMVFIDVILKSQFIMIFADISNIDIISSDFLIQRLECFFKTFNVTNLIVQNCQFNFMDFKGRYFLTYFTRNIIFEDVFLNIQNTNDSELFIVQESEYMLLKQITINGDNLYNTQIFQISNSTRLQLDELKIIIKNSKKSIFYLIKWNQLIEIYNCYVYGIYVQQTTFFSLFFGDVILKNNIYVLENSQYNTILIIEAKNLMIDNFTFQQSQNENNFDNINEGQYNYLYIIRIDFGIISNFFISGVKLKNYGLMDLHVSDEVKLTNLLIENINFISDSFQSLLSFQEHQNYPSYLLSDLNIKNVTCEVYNEIILINFWNIVNIKIINITLDNILSYLDMGYMLRILSKQTSIYSFKTINCQGFNVLEAQTGIIQLNNLNFKNNRQNILFSSLTPNSEIFWIENCIIEFSQIVSGIIIASKYYFPPLNIIIKNITIDQMQSTKRIFVAEGDAINLHIYHSLIQRINVDQIYQVDSIFCLEFSKFRAYNLTIQNVRDPIFSILQSKFILLSKISILNGTNTEFLVEILNSPVIVENLRIYNLQNIRTIIKIISYDKNQYMYFNNLILVELQNITEVITYYQSQEKQQQINIQNIILISCEIVNLFGIISEQQQNIKIQNLFTNQGKLHLQEGETTKFQFINSFLSGVTFQVIDQDKIILQSSEVIGNELQYTNQFDLKYSQIYDSINLLSYFRIPFFMTLSLDGGKNLQKIQLQEQFSFKIKIKENLTYFYVPSGQKLSQYKRLNLKQLSYQQIYFSLLLVVKGFTFQSDKYYLCSQQQYYNEELIHDHVQNFTISEEQSDIDQIFIINPYNQNYTIFKIKCEFSNQITSLQFNVKSFHCQLGEYFYKNQCVSCNTSLYQYSVTYNSTKCSYMDFNKIKKANAGLLELQLNYWRFKFNSPIIESCESQNCNGGWIPGDQSCVKSRVGALCKECDLYNVRGDGQYTNNNGECTHCQLSINFILQFLFVVILQQFFALLAYNTNNNTSNQYLLYKIGFKQFYQILYRQSVDQPSIMIKMYTNYLFLLYVIRENFDVIGKLFIININIMNNPSLIFQASLTCILSELTQLNIIYSYFFYEIFLPLLVISITFTIYLIVVLLKIKQFQIRFIIFFLDNVFVYNLKLITETATNLLSYIEISQQKWIRENVQYLFYSDTHMHMIKYIIPIIAIIFVFPLIIPYVSKNLHILSRRAIRIFSIYFQEYKPQLFYWEYCIIYTKYLIMILQIQENQAINLQLLTIIVIIWASYNLKPYYLQNLNSYECNLFILYSIQLHFLIVSKRISFIIIIINLYIFFLLIRKLKNSYYLLNMKKILYYEQKIKERFPKFINFLGLNQLTRNESNRKLLIKIIRTKIMKKQYIEQKSNLHYQLETEIELESFKQTLSRIYPSRQE